jgi:uncharacterized damage-inducible protein DinB
MSESKRIAQQMKQGFAKDCWAGPSLLEVLDSVDYKMASAKPIPGAHTIWEIVMHLIAGQRLLTSMVSGARRTPAPEEEWWLPVPQATEANWLATRETLKMQEEQFRNAVESFPDDRLDSPLVKGGSSAYNNLHGHLQHTLYHAGQIVMLKKAIENK